MSGEVQVTLNGGPNPRTLKSAGMSVWVAEKFNRTTEIAGSPRNSFRASLKCKSLGGRALIGLGVLIGLPNSVKLRMPMTYP